MKLPYFRINQFLTSGGVLFEYQYFQIVIPAILNCRKSLSISGINNGNIPLKNNGIKNIPLEVGGGNTWKIFSNLYKSYALNTRK